MNLYMNLINYLYSWIYGMEIISMIDIYIYTYKYLNINVCIQFNIHT
jgi:hypothetical protein